MYSHDKVGVFTWQSSWNFDGKVVLLPRKSLFISIMRVCATQTTVLWSRPQSVCVRVCVCVFVHVWCVCVYLTCASSQGFFWSSNRCVFVVQHLHAAWACAGYLAQIYKNSTHSNDITHVCVWHDSLWHVAPRPRWHDSSKCVQWHIYMYDSNSIVSSAFSR